MVTGISTACLYPLVTEKALDILLEAGFRTFEFFVNCDSEMSDEFLGGLNTRLKEKNASVYSLHFYTAVYEPYMFFSDYQRRFDDGLELYRRYCASAARIGAKVVVFHGDRRNSELPLEDFCERFYTLSKMARSEGVTLAQENVSRCRSAELSQIREMHRLLGSDIKFTLDIKQAVRAQENPLEVLKEMGADLVNVHVSDNTPEHDCLLPGAGSMDLKTVSATLGEIGYKGPMIIEVYRVNFKEHSELRDAGEYLRGITGENLLND